MSKVELESFFKSFILFFISLGILISFLFYINYTKNIQTLDEKLFSQMRICSYDLNCKQFYIDFIHNDKQEQYKLYKNSNGLTSYYPIPNSVKNIMSISLNSEKYTQELKTLQKEALYYYFIFLAVIFILSILFSIYSLYPLRNALILTKEFIKDILHDFNTPLSSIRLNTSMLKSEIGENSKLSRIEQSMENVINLQQQLRYYLQNYTSQKESFDLQESIKNKLGILEKNYPNITFINNTQELTLFTNKEAFNRILDNILTNAAKYNKKDGKVEISLSKNSYELIIEDTGIGIQNTKRIFDRFYKEQTRGIGIGLHIVKKLCEELNISIKVESQINIGTKFILNISELTHH
ncbi:HAMP domain-containing histidine kinase [Arcobacteraceae bacterium]|nr:HAMP domain-containing histidine kinase [Arcobacteraceae bacterium]